MVYNDVYMQWIHLDIRTFIIVSLYDNELDNEV